MTYGFEYRSLPNTIDIWAVVNEVNKFDFTIGY